ncbi:MAG: XRE family transcriptional regulator, partial [Chitinophagaceae bacterium]
MTADINSKINLAQKIAAARKQKGLTQEQLADFTQVTVRTIQRIESGESIPRAHTVKALAQALDINFEELIKHDPETTHHAEVPAAFDLSASTHFLQMLCLSCFSYLIVPLVPFLVPMFVLKRAGNQPPGTMRFARKMVRQQIYWTVAVSFSMLLTLGYNFIRAAWFQKTHLLNYFLPLLLMFVLNAC